MGGQKNGTLKYKAKASSVLELWQKAITKNSSWPDKDEFLDIIYWTRQALGIILGIIWGIIPLKGFIGLFLRPGNYKPFHMRFLFGLFCIINAAIIYFYTSHFQDIDEEEFGGLWEITKEGFVTSFAGFLVMWIIIYSGLHFE